MNITIKVLVAKNKKTNEILDAQLLGDEDSSDKYTSLTYPISLFSFEQAQETFKNWSDQTKEYIGFALMAQKDFTLHTEAWNFPSIGDFEVSIVEKEVFLDLN